MPAPRRDLDRLRRALEAWLQQKLPGATAVEVRDARGPSETGYSSDTVLFDLEFVRHGVREHRRLVAKLHPQGVTVFPRYDLELQFRILQLLSEVGGVPVPRVLWLETDAAVVGGVFYVMEYVAGRVAPDNPPYHTSGWLLDLSPAQRADVWNDGIAAMARVHRVPTTRVAHLFPRPPAGQTYLQSQLEEYRSFVAWGLGDEDFPLLDCAAEWLQRHCPPEEQVALCWGDARIGNQIFAGTQCVALLDWEMARMGDPVQDVAWWWAIDRCFSEGLGVPRLEGLPDKEETLRHWERCSGFSAAYFEYYELLALYKFAAIMARVIRQLCHYGVFPADTAMVRDNLATAVLKTELAQRGE